MENKHMLNNKMELPEYYKTVIFRDINGKEHRGYLEPPFEIDDISFFFEENRDDVEHGLDGFFYHLDDVEKWRYVNKDWEN